MSVPGNLPSRFRSLLQGREKLVVWGATGDLIVNEWRRQIKAEFLVDTRWNWWNKEIFLGMPVYPPSEIVKLDPARALVANNFAYSASNRQVKEYLARIGSHQTIVPMSLRDIVCIAAKGKQKIVYNRNLVRHVNKGLQSILTPPAGLHRSRSLPGLNELADFFNSYAVDDYLRAALPKLHEKSMASYRARAGHVCLMLGSLNPGGAERQLCNLAVGLKRLGLTVTVLVYATDPSDAASYRQMLADNGVGFQKIGPPEDGPGRYLMPVFEGVSPDILNVLWHLHPTHISRALRARQILRELRPELLITYLDNNNTGGGLGGVLAGVPRIFMSGRSTARPYLVDDVHLSLHEFNHDMYRLLLPLKGVSLSNNSPYGAESYAKWLGISPKDISVVRNCVSEEFAGKVSSARIERSLHVLRLHKKDPLILGVFRIHPIKRPLDFVRVIAALHKKHPRLRAIICGGFEQKVDEVKNLIRELKLESILVLLSYVGDIPAMMHMATLLLHTAEVEGSPNVILEAQACGLPVVAADNSGVRLCLTEEWLPYTKKAGDIKGLTASCDALLKQPRLRKSLAAKSKNFVQEHHSLAALARNTLIASGYTTPRARK